MDNSRLTEDQVVEAVKAYFNQSRFRNFTIKTECNIQFGAGRGRNFGIADVVLSDDNGHWLTIVECKSEQEGDTENHRGQLRSYLSGTDTRLGILAFNDNPDEWIYCENQRANKFRVIDRSDLEELIFEPPTADRTNQVVLKQLQQRLKHVTITFAAALLIIIAACLSVYFLIGLPMHTDPQYQVVRIIDGDTVEIKYKGKLTSVQLFGINAPETTVHPSKPQEPYGREAHSYLQDLLTNDSVHLRFDEHMRDQYDRILGYVYRSSDGIFVNLEMIREGYAEVDLRYPFKYEELFTDYESRAKTDRKGLWGINFR